MAECGLKLSLLGAFQRARRAEKFVMLVLLFVLLSSAAAGVTQVLTGPDWTLLWESLLFGLLLGWLLAIFRGPAWRSAFVIIVAGMLFSTLSTGGLNAKIGAVVMEALRLPTHVSISLKAIHLDTANLSNAATEALISTRIVFSRVVNWLEALFDHQPAYDPVAAGFVWNTLVWMMASWAGWMIEGGKNAVLALLPALLLNLATLSYGQSSSLTIYLNLAATLVLIAIAQYDLRQQEWDERKVGYPSRKNRQIGYVALFLAILLVVLSAVFSSLSFHQITLWVSELRRPSSPQESNLAKSLGIRSATAAPDEFSPIRSPGMPRDLLIGAGPELSTEVVMSIEVKVARSPAQPGKLPPLYWRSFNYDIYTGQGWSSSTTQQLQYSPGQHIQPEDLPHHILVQETVRPAPGQGGTIYAAGEPVSVSIPSTAAWRFSNDLFGIQAESSSYEAQSLMPEVDETSLRSAGQDYPAWITQRYLSLPQEVPTRVRALALQLTATAPTPYDRARAIEHYLRQFPYTLDVPRPPINQDLVDYFLNDLRKGYCDYYASAMVVLARAAGIPSRLVIGYASGTYNLNSGRFVVTQADAHSWVEVYFPHIGWVPFEPTASQPVINLSNEQTPVVPSTEPPPVIPVIPLSWQINRFAIPIDLVVIAVLALFWAGFDEIHLQSMQPQSLAAEVYRRLKRYGRLLRLPTEPGQTPNEFADVLCALASEITAPRETHSQNPKVPQEVQSITRAIVRLSYRPAEGRNISTENILGRWRLMRWQLRIMYVMKAWQDMQQQFQQKLAGLRGEEIRPVD